MKFLHIAGQIAMIVLATTLSARDANATVEEGVARHIPWSGYWWPVGKGELLGPLEKFDMVSGRRALWWELENKPPGPHVPAWHGYCHGWSAAAVLENEPRTHKFVGGGRGVAPMRLSVADQKGWYSAAHAYDVANYYGDRYGDGEGSEDMQDIAPDKLWKLMKMFIKENGVPMVMDLDAGKQVWNYPVFAYRIEYYPHEQGGGWFRGDMQLCAADDAVPAEYVGTVPHLQTYTFIFRMHGGAVVLGSGRWTGQSVQNHPDFAWYPYVAMSENPELQYSSVKGLIGGNMPTNNQPANQPSSSHVEPPRETGSDNRETPSGSSSVDSPAVSQPSGAWLGRDRRPGRDSAATMNVPLPISPPQLVAAIAEKTSSFGLDARMARFGKVQYHIGDRVSVTGSSEQAGHLYVLHVSPAGELALLHPAPGQDNRIKAGATFRVPSPRQGDYAISGPFGNHRIKVLVTKRPLALTGIDRRAPLGADAESQEKGWRGYAFRFFPTQHKQIKALLRDYVEGKNLDADRLDRIDATDRLGSFAQDEITYYVGPNEAANGNVRKQETKKDLP